VPAQHCSRRPLLDYNRALSGGFVIEANGFKIYFAGDTGYNAHFRQIRSCFPQIDLALLPVGGYEPRWLTSFQHMDREEAVRSHLDLDAKLSIGMHYATFQLSDEAIDAPTTALAAAQARFGVTQERFRTLQFGETMLLQREHATTDGGLGVENSIQHPAGLFHYEAR
jgi:L-ascorbate metabolism protein UlaG (beta-lactamase superfamily)